MKPEKSVQSSVALPSATRQTTLKIFGPCCIALSLFFALYRHPASLATFQTFKVPLLSRTVPDIISLQHLGRSLLRAGEIVKLSVPYEDYWVAELQSADGHLLVPVYRADHDSHLGLFWAPKEGPYSLTIRVPVLYADDRVSEAEPFSCLLWRYLGFDNAPGLWARVTQQNSTLLPAVQYMRKWCLQGQAESGWDQVVNASHGYRAPYVAQHNASIVFTTVLQIQPAIDNQERKQKDLRALAQQVYGTSSPSFNDNGAATLGFWRLNDAVNETIGSPNYQPQRPHCLPSFTFRLDVETVCPDQDTRPTFLWEPYHTDRAHWMLRPQQIADCYHSFSQIRMHGDSIMWGLRRGVECLMRGYAGLSEGEHYSVPYGFELTVELSPFFASRDILMPEISDTEAAILLGTSNHMAEPGNVDIWLFGMWMISYTPSEDWPRAIDRIFSILAKRQADHGVRPIIVLIPQPQSDPAYPSEPGWQTAGRAYQWNQIVRRTASRHDISVVDLFWPSTTRFDGRIDNCHACDNVNIEYAMMLFNTMCPSPGIEDSQTSQM